MTTNETLTVAESFAEVNKLFDVPALIGETCDSCGPGVPAKHVAMKNGMNLFFCSHHARKNNDKLTSTGFTLYPGDIQY